MEQEQKPETPKQDIREAQVNLMIALIGLRNKTTDRLIGVSSLMGYLKSKNVIYYVQDISEVLIEKGYVLSEGVLRKRNIQWISKQEITSDLAFEIITTAQQYRREKLKAHHNKRREKLPEPTSKNKPKPVTKKARKVKKVKEKLVFEPIVDVPPTPAPTPNFIELLNLERDNMDKEYRDSVEEYERLKQKIQVLQDRVSSMDLLIGTYA
jgi:hypothetical protein